jgi:hypothetical protein
MSATLAGKRKALSVMSRSSTRTARRPLPCSCLAHAFRTFPAHASRSLGCDSPHCLARTLDGITLHQFVEAIGGYGRDTGEGAGLADGPEQVPVPRPVPVRPRQPKTTRRPK